MHPLPMEAAGAVDAKNAPTAPCKTHRTRFPQLPQAPRKVLRMSWRQTVADVLTPSTLAVPPSVRDQLAQRVGNLVRVRQVRTLEDVRERRVRVRVGDTHHGSVERLEFFFH